MLNGHGLSDGGGHVRFISGDVIWCDRCGAYAISQAIGLAKPCVAKPSGGTATRLGLLRRGLHPITRLPLGDDTLPESRAGVPLRPLADAVASDAVAGPSPVLGAVEDSPPPGSKRGRLQVVRERILRRIRLQSGN